MSVSRRAGDARARVSVGTALGIGWLAAVAVIAVARALHRGPSDADLAASPARLAAGELWPLVTSAFVIAGSPVVQIAATAVLLAAVVRLHGAGLFWLTAAAGHLGATLVTYAGVGVLWLVSRADVDSVVEAPDYGISAIWSAALGALAVGAAATPRWRWPTLVASAVCLLVLLAPTPFGGDLAGVEHVVAFALGATVTRWRVRAVRKQPRPAPSNEHGLLRLTRRPGPAGRPRRPSAVSASQPDRPGPPPATKS